MDKAAKARGAVFSKFVCCEILELLLDCCVEDCVVKYEGCPYGVFMC